MTPLLMAMLFAIMVATAFLSGIFGMAGGLILMGVLLALMPVPAAMMLHGVTQLASNGWRAFLWRDHIVWKPVGYYMTGCAAALALWSLVDFVPTRPMALLFLGLSPFAVRLLPASLKPDPGKLLHGTIFGGACTSLMLLTGVSGPLLDTYFLGGAMDRRQLVATKATCQVLGHAIKLVYFGGIVTAAANIDPVLAVLAVAASMIGTSLARRILEAMSDKQFRVWANRIIMVIATYYVGHAAWLFATS
ncbi:MAG: TSUP family transporter [Reyranellaceae bacterium]